MPWWELLALGVGAMTKKPDRDSYSGPQMPGRTGEINQMVGDAFNPQSNLYRLAQEQYSANTQGQLARMGLGHSSLALQAQQTGSANLANKFLETEMQRRRNALMTERDYIMGGAKVAGAQHTAGLKDYAYDLRDAGSVARSIGNLGSTYRENQRWDEMMDMYRS